MTQFTMTCPNVRTNADKILLSHGSGGKHMQELIETVFLPAFGQPSGGLHDGAFINIGGSELAFTTDSYVVQPLFFPGGNIGDLAVCGTVNDLAMCGARPLYLSCGFILEEGFEQSKLIEIVQSMKAAADRACVKLVTGDTKVIENKRGDGMYINTSGIGVVEFGAVHPQGIQSGDLILINGDVGRHGTAVMSIREGLAFETTIESDTCELSTLVQTLLKEGVELHCLRDLTRGGLATALVELAMTRGVEIEIDENIIPVDETVRGAAEFLGLDPLYIACEGRMIAFVPEEHAEKALGIMERFGNNPQIIGRVKGDQRALVTSKTCLGTHRILDLLTGDQLPRIC